MNTDPLLACQQMFCVCYKHLHLQYKLYLCGIHFAYFRTGVQRPLIENDNSGVRIIMLLKVLNVNMFKKATKSKIVKTGYISPYMDYLLHAACVTLTSWGIYN